MVCEIKWTETALNSYISNIEYLEKDWSAKEISAFKTTVLNTIEIVSQYPRLGKITHKRKQIRRILIHKKISLYYQYNIKTHTLFLIVFWNNLQKPQKLKL